MINEKNIDETKVADSEVSIKVRMSKSEDANETRKKSVTIIQGKKDEVEAILKAVRSENEFMVFVEKLN